MTDEQRQKLVARFKSHEVVMWTDIDLAADEIERLAEWAKTSDNVNDELRSEIGGLRSEIERLAAANRELKKTLHHFLRERETDMGTAE